MSELYGPNFERCTCAKINAMSRLLTQNHPAVLAKTAHLDFPKNPPELASFFIGFIQSVMRSVSFSDCAQIICLK